MLNKILEGYRKKDKILERYRKKVLNIKLFLKRKKSNIPPVNFIILTSLFLVILLSLLIVSAIGSTNYNITVPTLSDGAGNASSTNYSLATLLGEIAGNMSSSSYNTKLGFWYTISIANTAPNTPSVSINSTDLSNKTAVDLNCFSTITDPNSGNKLNVTVQWYKNNTLNLTIDYNNSYANGTAFVAVLDDGNTTKNDVWHCGMRLYDGQAYSAWANSSNLTIVNSAPTVTLTAPADGNITTNRTPIFSWSGSDDDNDPLTYEINITCREAGSIVTAGSVYVNKETLGSATSYTPTSYLKCLSDNGQIYNWTVRAYDGVNYSSWAAERNISIQSLVTISLPTSAVNFGSMNISQSKNTTSGDPAPLVLSNDGNSELNISVNFTDLWQIQSNPSSYYQYKIRNTSAGCFVVTGTQTSWANAPSITTNAINRFNFTSGYQTGCSNTSVDILIEVPVNEPPGNKSSIITFISSLGEQKVS